MGVAFAEGSLCSIAFPSLECKEKKENPLGSFLYTKRIN